jgi:cell division protease FtsH
VERQDFEAAIERIVAGLERKNRLLSPREREVVAHHELGHAIVASATPGADPVHKISIIPRGIGALGYTLQRPTEDRYLMTREELEAKLAVLLGGRAAEHVVYGHLSTGAADDLARASEIARSMVTRYAMVPSLGHVAYDTEPAGFAGPAFRQRLYSDDTAREIDCAVRRIVEAAFERARRTLLENRAVLDEGARSLLARETLDGAELEAIFVKLARGAAAASGSAARGAPAAQG